MATLEELKKRRDTLRDSVQRIKGRLDSARNELKAVEDELTQKKVPPEKLEEAIQKLNGRYDTLVVELQTKIESAEVTVAPYVKEEA